jgi:mRNA interferase RelE/StbE
MPLDITRDAYKFLNELPPKQFKQIAAKIFSLLREPRPHDSSHLSGHPGYMRVTSGEYRIIYKHSNDVIQIVLIGKRNDDEIYKALRNLKG